MSRGADLARRLERDAPLGAEAAVDEPPRAEQGRTGEVPDQLHLDAELVAGAHVAEHPEVVDRGEVARRRRAATARREERASALRERLQHERGRQAAVAA